ncbi:MAG: hypothetical protein RLP02_11820, partial [Coleofasciculus sp. C2-GNP5-27]
NESRKNAFAVVISRTWRLPAASIAIALQYREAVLVGILTALKGLLITRVSGATWAGISSQGLYLHSLRVVQSDLTLSG